MVDAICGNIGPCCVEEELPFEEAGCTAFMTGLLSRLVPRDPSLATFDADAAASCIEAATDLASACPQTLAQQRSFTEACVGVFTGTLGPGEACETSPECAAPSGGLAYCIPGPSGGAVCNQLTLGALGEGCAGDTLVDESGERLVFSFSFETELVLCDLDAGLVCDPVAAEPTCRALFEVDDACPGTGSCAPGLACLFADDEAGLVCVPRAAEGDPCDRDQPGEVCDDGLHCSAGAAVCAPRLAVGEVCSEATDCLSRFCDEESGLCQGVYSNHYVCDGERERAGAR